jgi:glutathione S-transferase
MKLYFNPQSRAVIAKWMLDECGADYQLVTIDLTLNEHKRADYLKINPAGKLPALVDGEARVFENVAICLYLADRFPEANLAPPIGDPRRGRYLSLTVYSTSQLDGAVVDDMLGVKTERQRGWTDFATCKTVIERELGAGPFLLGEQFTAADVMIGSIFIWQRMMGNTSGRPRSMPTSTACSRGPRRSSSAVEMTRVCVVGAGPAGLVATRTLVGAGLEVDCFEMSPEIGGHWVIDNPNGRSAAYRSLETNTTHRMSRLSDYEMPAEWPDFPGHALVRQWFEDYVDRSGFRARIALRTEVVSARPEQPSGWRVQARGGGRIDGRAALRRAGSPARATTGRRACRGSRASSKAKSSTHSATAIPTRRWRCAASASRWSGSATPAASSRARSARRARRRCSCARAAARG